MIDPQVLLDWSFEDVVQDFGRRDAALYALGIGLGTDPLDEGQLRFVREEDNLAFPTMPVALCWGPPFTADPRTGITRSKVVHGEQGVELLRPFPNAGRLRGRDRITAVVDKGEGKGAVIYSESTLLDDATGAPLAKLWRSIFARADGGFGGSPQAPRVPHPLPDRAPDASCELPSFANQALLYRLSGDRNPLHSHPEAGRRAGFDRPILHGLCTFGVAAHAVLRCFGDYDPARLRSIDARFSAPVFPGETLFVELWQDGEVISFRVQVRARGAKVLDNGKAVITV